jgi:genome maintenance exonuclease 1
MMKKFTHIEAPVLLNIETDESNGRREYILPDGTRYPSVTTILSYFKSAGLQKWRDRVGETEAKRIMTVASQRGTRFHGLLENYLNNKPNLFEGVLPDLRQNVKDVVDEIDNIRHIEAPLYSHVFRTAGRTDVIGDFRKVLSIIDFKTALRKKKEEYVISYFEQETAYAEMYEHMTGVSIQQLVTIIMVDGEDEPQVYVKQRKDYRKSLIEKITTYHKEYGYVS